MMTRFRLSFSGTLLLSLLVVNSYASNPCGVLRLQKLPKPGVDIINNQCINNQLALASVLQLQPDASVRLESSSGDSEAPRVQIICQNKSSLPLKIKVTSASLPWIQPEQNFIVCNDWVNGRMECNKLKSAKKVLICAIPLKMRTGPPGQATNMEIEEVNYELKKKVVPKIEGCRKEFPSDQGLTLSWTIKSNGVVADTAISQDINKDEFVECAVDVIEGSIFPQFDNDILFTHEF